MPTPAKQAAPAALGEDKLQRTRLVDEVTTRLREMIISGKLPAGTKLLQIELAEQLGVSRTPLREAFRLLERDGLVRVSNMNRTIEVVTITSAELAEMYEVREVIDGLAARLAARKGLPDDVLAELDRLLGVMKESADPYDPAKRTAAHTDFHALIAEHCGNPRLEMFIPLIRVSSAALYLPFIDDPHAAGLVNDGKLLTHGEAMAGAQKGHEAIVDAIRAGDPRKAESAARQHIARTLRQVPRLDEWRAAIQEANEQRQAANQG